MFERVKILAVYPSYNNLKILICIVGNKEYSNIYFSRPNNVYVWYKLQNQ